MNDLERYFAEKASDGPLLHKWAHYFEIYDRHFSRFRGTDVHVLEIGVSNGGSLSMWRDYFGPDAVIYGADINPHCRQFEAPAGPAARVFIGDQADRAFLGQIRAEIPRIDVLIDDGGHKMDQQLTTFEELYPSVSERGIYLCEDVHTSYWRDWGGGYRRKGTFVEMAKGLVDLLHGWHSPRVQSLGGEAFTKSAHGVHFYDSIVVVEKRPMEPPREIRAGHQTVPLDSEPHVLPDWKRKSRAVFRRFGIEVSGKR